MPFELSDITYHYGAKKVIDGISVDLATAKFYGIIGPNGSGKTTLLDLVAGHTHPATGQICYLGKALTSFSKPELAREVALVPQNFYINFPFTVREIVMMGRYPYIGRFAMPSVEDRNVVRDVMERSEIIEFAERYVTELSGGERQRVVFARALAQNTPVLILDEATSNLDINYSLSLLDLAADRVQSDGKTVIAVLQDINLAALYCDYLIFMSKGRIVEHGAVEDILHSDVIGKVFNVDAKVYSDSYSESLQVVFRR